MRESRSYGSVRGALREKRPYRNSGFELQESCTFEIVRFHDSPFSFTEDSQ
jgi:hypothetical protein